VSAVPTRRLDSLTSLRFFAAAFVAVGHWGNVVHPQSRLHQLLEGSYLGVSFFFVLSGFVLTWSHQPGDTARGFYWRRFARIWPLYALTLALSLGVISLERGEIHLSQGVPSLFFVQAFVPSIAVMYFGNSPAWSLSCEAFFYSLFPLLRAKLSGSTVRQLQVIVGLVVAAQVSMLLIAHAIMGAGALRDNYLYVNPLLRLDEFTIGIALALAVRRGWRPAISPTVAFFVLMVGVVGVSVPNHALPSHIGGLFALPGIVLVIASCATRELKGAPVRLLTHRLLVRLGVWSFALYMTHQLLLRILVVDYGRYRLDSVPQVIAYPAFLAVAVAVAGVFSTLVEQPAERRLRRAVSRGPALSTADELTNGQPARDVRAIRHPASAALYKPATRRGS
jgi:peptidoglycan/LPS O-acetylase OafA/YrhL